MKMALKKEKKLRLKWGMFKVRRKVALQIHYWKTIFIIGKKRRSGEECWMGLQACRKDWAILWRVCGCKFWEVAAAVWLVPSLAHSF